MGMEVWGKSKEKIREDKERVSRDVGGVGSE